MQFRYLWKEAQVWKEVEMKQWCLSTSILLAHELQFIMLAVHVGYLVRMFSIRGQNTGPINLKWIIQSILASGLEVQTVKWKE